MSEPYLALLEPHVPSWGYEWPLHIQVGSDGLDQAMPHPLTLSHKHRHYLSQGQGSAKRRQQRGLPWWSSDEDCTFQSQGCVLFP